LLVASLSFPITIDSDIPTGKCFHV
jgi:hypothetical protein